MNAIALAERKFPSKGDSHARVSTNTFGNSSSIDAATALTARSRGPIGDPSARVMAISSGDWQKLRLLQQAHRTG